MNLFKELTKEAQNRAASFFEPKVGYKLVGNPYVTDIAEDVEDYIRSAKMEYYFDNNGCFICAQTKEW